MSAHIQPPPVLVVMGVSGSGKSTVAGLLAGRTGWPLLEGDDVHPQANVDKMAAGHPLNDDDRWPWLDAIADWIHVREAEGSGAVVTCSALKRRYRDRLLGPHVLFVHLAGSRDRISERLNARMNHYMPPTLLDSQIADLEPIEPDEQAITVDVGGTPQEITDEVMRQLAELTR